MYHTEPYQNKCIIHRKLYIASWLGTGAPYASLGARYNEGRATRLGRGRVRPERLLAPGDGTGRRRGARQGRPDAVARHLRLSVVHFRHRCCFSRRRRCGLAAAVVSRRRWWRCLSRWGRWWWRLRGGAGALLPDVGGGCGREQHRGGGAEVFGGPYQSGGGHVKPGLTLG
jgi:hypothetical protein